ncbi:MAG: hypothetical protein LBQ62_02900 [Candidatus Accumulibacter sp.]|jgi:hypothetical protein|nr:hypothetical protein [Accumulibacter sp.]
MRPGDISKDGKPKDAPVTGAPRPPALPSPPPDVTIRPENDGRETRRKHTYNGGGMIARQEESTGKENERAKGKTRDDP